MLGAACLQACGHLESSSAFFVSPSSTQSACQHAYVKYSSTQSTQRSHPAFVRRRCSLALGCCMLAAAAAAPVGK